MHYETVWETTEVLENRSWMETERARVEKRSNIEIKLAEEKSGEGCGACL